MHASDIVVLDEIQYVGPAIASILATSDYHREWGFRRKDRSEFSADVIVTVMPDGNLLAMIRDVTARNETEVALRSAEERMRFILQSAHIGTWDMDYASGRLQWSDVMEVQFGLAPGAFAGTFEAFVACIHPEDQGSVLAIVGNAMKAGSDFEVLHRIIRPDGTERWMSGAGRVLIDEAGRPLRAVGISQDVTERHTLEAQFQQSQKMEAIGRLAGGVAHDFNNLLTVILGFCELLLAGAEAGDPLRSDIAEIQKAGMRTAELTRQLLAFSRE